MTNLLFLSELREICFHIYTSVSERFPDSKITAVGAFIFLRGFCPAIVSPHVYGISKAAPSKDAQRILTLVAKTIQNLANNVKFGKKEEYMAIMNEFIESKLPAVQEFLLSLAVQTTILHINTCLYRLLHPQRQLHEHQRSLRNKRTTTSDPYLATPSEYLERSTKMYCYWMLNILY
jgi:hypothetical protein